METQIQIKEKSKIVSFLFASFFWKILLAISAIGGILSAFTNFEFVKCYPWLVGSYLIITVIIISLLLVINRIISNDIHDTSKLDISAELLSIVKRQYANQEYLDLIRFGSKISRYLWLKGANNERIEVGKLVTDAASKLGRRKEQISALIDDIGWTYFVTGNVEKAKENINHGIEKATEDEEFFFAAKGERHLAGINSSTGKKEDVLDHLEKAEDFTKRVKNKREKDEMKSSLLLAKAEYYFENYDFEKAIANAEDAKEVLVNDPDRIVKVYSLLGNIFLANQKYPKAKDEFNQGYLKCKGVRTDEYAKNAIGLAKIELKSNNLNAAKNYLSEAQTILSSSNKNSELIEVNQLLQKIANAN